MCLLRPWVLATALGLFGALSASAQTPSQDLAELDRLQTLSQRNSAETVQALQAAAPRFARAAHVDTRRTYRMGVEKHVAAKRPEAHQLGLEARRCKPAKMRSCGRLLVQMKTLRIVLGSKGLDGIRRQARDLVAVDTAFLEILEVQRFGVALALHDGRSHG